MGAYDELAHDGPGEATRALLHAVVADVAGARGLVPPAPHAGWTPVAVGDAVTALLGTHGTGFVLACWARAQDDASLVTVTSDVVGALLTEDATGWGATRLAERLEHVVLPGDAGLQRAGDRWGLTGTGSAPVVEVPRSDGRGTATGPVLRALVHEALAAAGAPLSTTALARSVGARLAPPRRRTPRPILVPGVGESASPMEDGPEPGVLVRAFAEELWDGLSPLERTLVPHLGRPPVELGAVLELPAAAAEVAADELVARLRAACADDDRAAEVLVELRGLCTQRP